MSVSFCCEAGRAARKPPRVGKFSRIDSLGTVFSELRTGAIQFRREAFCLAVRVVQSAPGSVYQVIVKDRRGRTGNRKKPGWQGPLEVNRDAGSRSGKSEC